MGLTGRGPIGKGLTGRAAVSVVCSSCPQSLGLVLVHAHSHLATENSGQNRTTEGQMVKRLDPNPSLWPLSVFR